MSSNDGDAEASARVLNCSPRKRSKTEKKDDNNDRNNNHETRIATTERVVRTTSSRQLPSTLTK